MERMGTPYHILDPVSGSGTVLYECGKRGWKCTGLEGDPFLRWISAARSRRFRKDAGEFAGYAWERVSDDVFWESERFRVPDISGTISFRPEVADFLSRVRRQLDRETDEGINDLLRLALCRMLPLVSGDGEFDDTAGMALYAECLSDICASMDPNSERCQSVNLADGREIPPMLRDAYDAVVSIMPPVSERPDSEYRRTMCQWIGFDNIVRRDAMSIGYPLGDFGEYMRGYVPDSAVAEAIPFSEPPVHLVRWISDAVSFAESAAGVMSSSGTGRFLMPDEIVDGRCVRKADIVAEILSERGIPCEKEGTGSMRSIAFGSSSGK